MLQVKKFEDRFMFLEPPASRGMMTVADVVDAVSVEDHLSKVREWAVSAWNAWSSHHEIVRSWLPFELKS
jgi:hypothetical protein